MNTSIPAIAARRQALVYLPWHNPKINKFDDALTALASRIIIEASGKALDTGRFIAALDHLVDAKVFMANALLQVDDAQDTVFWSQLPAIHILKQTEKVDTTLVNILFYPEYQFVESMCRIFRDFNEQVNTINFGLCQTVRHSVFEQVVNHLFMAHTCFTMAAMVGQATSPLYTSTALAASVTTSTPQPVFEKNDSPKKRQRGEAQLDLSSPKKDTTMTMMNSLLTSLTKEQNEITKAMAENDDDDLEE